MPKLFKKELKLGLFPIDPITGNVMYGHSIIKKDGEKHYPLWVKKADNINATLY